MANPSVRFSVESIYADEEWIEDNPPLFHVKVEATVMPDGAAAAQVVRFLVTLPFDPKATYRQIKADAIAKCVAQADSLRR